MIERLKQLIGELRGWVRRLTNRARIWALRPYILSISAIGRFRSRRQTVIELTIWLIALLIGAAFLTPVQIFLTDHELTTSGFDDLQAAILTVSGAMIGATAIVSSFVLFALQVNVERLPYGLFRRFSSDVRLLGSFGAAFAFSIAAAALSLNQHEKFAALTTLVAIAAVIAVLRLLLYAFRRSLTLINPLQQLKLVRESAAKQMRTFERRVGWLVALARDRAEQTGEPKDDGAQAAEERVEENKPRFDGIRGGILDANANWNRPLREAVKHAVTYARKAGEHGDFEVSAAALVTIVSLNQTYIHAKGSTFYGSVPLFHDPRVTDGFINQTLEELRRLREAVLARRDETQAEQIYRTFLGLVRTYFVIEYPSENSSKFHASLAGAYLERSVEAAARGELTDNTMAGLAIIREAAQVFLVGGRPTEMTNFAKTIGMIGTVGLLKEDTRPVTLSAVEQLTEITLTLLRIESSEIRFAAGQIRQSVTMIARMALELPDTPIGSMHSNYLAPYFSSTSFTSFRAQLTPLVNALLQANKDDEGARTVAYNISEWADDIHRDLKGLLVAAVSKQSHFSFDLIHWITDVSELLICVARAPATAGYVSEKLEDEAETLFLVLTWIPREPATARWLEAYSFTETILEYALKSHSRDFQPGFERAWRFLLQWTVEAGREETGWGTLDHGLTAMVALALVSPEARSDALKAQLQLSLAQPNAPDKEVRATSARRLRSKADNLQRRQFGTRLVERVLEGNEPEATRTLLREIADILSPNQPNEAAGPEV